MSVCVCVCVCELFFCADNMFCVYHFAPVAITITISFHFTRSFHLLLYCSVALFLFMFCFVVLRFASLCLLVFLHAFFAATFLRLDAT